MTEEHENAGLADKVRETAEKAKETLEPDESAGPSRPVNDASDPFTNDRRPEEAGFDHGSVAGTD